MTNQDKLLFAASCAGDTTAFGELVCRYQAFVASIAYSETGDLDRSEEIAQQTFVTAWERRRSLKDPDRLVSWLAGIARNLLRTDYRQRKKQVASDSIDQLVSNQPSQLERCIDREQQRMLWAVLEGLPPTYREPLVLFHRQGRSISEVARLLEISEATTRQRLSRGRKMIRSELAKFVEEALSETAPGPNFSLGVVAALSSLSGLGAKAAGAATQVTSGAGSTAKPAVAATQGVNSGLKTSLAIGGGLAAVTVLIVGLVFGGIYSFNQIKKMVEVVRVEPHEFQLENGMTVFLRPVKGTQDVAIVTAFDVGEIHDPAGKSGLAHLIEHLYVTSATPETPARNIRQYQAAYPKGWNAQTGADSTIISTVTDATDLESELDDCAARMSRLQITQADLDREIPRMIQEVNNMFDNFPPLAASNRAHELLHPRPHTGRKGGHPDEIAKLSLQDSIDHWKSFYKPSNATLVIAGKFDIPKTELMVRAAFSDIDQGRKPAVPINKNKPVYDIVETELANNRSPIAVMAIACPPVDSDLFPAFVAITTQLAKDGKRISKDVQKAPALFMPLDDFGTLYLRAWAEKGGNGKFESSNDLVVKLNGLVDGLDPKRVAKRGNFAAQNTAFLLDTVPIRDSILTRNLYGVAFGIARRHQLGLDGPTLGAELQELTAEQVQECIDEYLTPEKRTVSIVN